MKHNVIFVEGLPGSGKSTFARRLYAHYKNLGFKVKMYQEGDLHPIDLAWCSYFDENQYQAILEKYPTMVEEIKRNTLAEGPRRIVSYTRVRHDDTSQAFFAEMAQYEIYRNHTAQELLQAHLERWSRFNETFDSNTLYIFECIFLQNHITELILNHNQTKADMMPYFQALVDSIQDTNPVVYYIQQQDIPNTLKRIISERRTTDPSRYNDWIEDVKLYLNSTKYAHTKGFIGEEGMLRYGSYRQQTELEILSELGIPYNLYELKGDYESVFQHMIADELS